MVVNYKYVLKTICKHVCFYLGVLYIGDGYEYCIDLCSQDVWGILVVAPICGCCCWGYILLIKPYCPLFDLRNFWRVG